jgi:hypothetical protein
MTSLIEAIQAVQNAKEGSRPLDRQVAEAIGWRRELKEVTDDSGKTISRGMWYPPNSEKSGTIPSYTSDLDAAQKIVSLIGPAAAQGGCSWEPGKASAQIVGFPAVEARTPALALCSAAMRAMHYTAAPKAEP